MNSSHLISGEHRMLLLRLSSFGDVVQSFYVLSDIKRARPEIRICWCVDERFSDLAALHPAVETVISFPARQWKKSLLQPKLLPEIFKWVRHLRSSQFDMTLDLQGMYKSALIGWMSGAALRIGPSRGTISERGAHLFYRREISLAKLEGLASRARHFAGSALHYTASDYRLDSGVYAWRKHSQHREVLFILGTSRREKSWNNSAWASLGHLLIRELGLKIQLLWGNSAERDSAIEVEKAVGSDSLRIADRIYPVDSLKAQLCSASAVVGGDTGLTHLAAALGSPTLMLFFATKSARYTHPELGNLEFLDVAYSPVTVKAVAEKIEFLLRRF